MIIHPSFVAAFRQSLFLCTAILLFGSFSLHLQAQNINSNCTQLDDWLYFNNSPWLETIDFQHSDQVRSVYDKNNCQPLWYNESQQFALIEELQELLGSSANPQTHHLNTIAEYYDQIQTELLPFGLFDHSVLLEIDLLLTDAALHYVDGLSVDMGDAVSYEPQLAQALYDALAANELTSFIYSVEDGSYWMEAPDMLDATISEDVDATSKDDVTKEEVKEEVEAADTKVDNEKSDTATNEDAVDTTEETTGSSEKKIVDQQLFEQLSSLSEENADQVVEQVRLHQPARLQDFYAARNYAPVWHNETTLIGIADQLLLAIGAAGEDGLRPTRYHSETISNWIREINNVYAISGLKVPDIDTKIELVFTDAALQLAHDLVYGRLTPNQRPYNWDVNNDEFQLTPAFEKAVESGDLLGFFDGLRPQHPQYARLRSLLKSLQQQKEEAPLVVLGENEPKLEQGMTHDGVVALRARLGLNSQTFNAVKIDSIAIPPDGYSADSASIAATIDSFRIEIDSIHDARVFDGEVKSALMRFQRSSGLEEDGVAGKNTIGHLNLSNADKIKRIELDLERWRWLARDLGPDHLLANIPSYMLHVTEDRKPALEKVVVVGKTYHKTATFSELMSYIEINPYWTVPYSISTREILPKLKRDPGYLGRNNMKLFSGGKSISPYSVDWSSVSRGSFRYRIRQEPGDKNALGRVKFMFPNQYNIYIHDTPSKKLFARSQRAFSHGCVRLNKPFELAEYLLSKSAADKWTPEKIQKTKDRGKNKRVQLEKPWPIHILYFTTWVEEEGNTRFLHDIYGRNKALSAALR